MNVRRSNEQGMVSILVTMVIMLVISLIVIGFATLSRREQRQALDRQLSTQAFYAAEAGVNDAVAALKANPGMQKTNCDGQVSVSANPVLDADAGVEYTCVLIDSTPNSLEYASIETENATVIPLLPASGALQSIGISWQDKTGGTNYAGCPTPTGGQYVLPTAANWPNTCNAGVLRIELVPRDASVSRASLMNRSLVAFLYPQNGGTNPSTHTYAPANPDRGAIIPANCNASASPRKCNVTINLSGVAGVSGYYLRARSIYRASNLSVIGFLSPGQAVDMLNAQAVVDSTGKANDVLRRISVRVPLTNLGSNVPSWVVNTTNSLCKRFGIAPNVSPVSDTNDPACQID